MPDQDSSTPELKSPGQIIYSKDEIINFISISRAVYNATRGVFATLDISEVNPALYQMLGLLKEHIDRCELAAYSDNFAAYASAAFAGIPLPIDSDRASYIAEKLQRVYQPHISNNLIATEIIARRFLYLGIFINPDRTLTTVCPDCNGHKHTPPSSDVKCRRCI